MAGILRFRGPPLNHQDILSLKAMGRRLRYRGPDDEQLWTDGDKVAFLFRRLSILDLEGGRQPMTDTTGQVSLMVNGEIYNYQDIRQKLKYPFKSKCDSEVILPLYQNKKERLVEDLIGMFAIALWDKKEEKLFLIRDHLGIKPLYYTITKMGHLLFASEIKALLAHPECPREMDWFWNLFQRENSNLLLDQPMKSGFKDIIYLPPGSMLVVDQKQERLTSRRWWSLKSQEENPSRTEEQVIEGYRELLQDSVHRQLMSDVEVGIALSGGIDSAAIAAFAAQKMPIKTFSILNLSTFQSGDAEGAANTAKFLRMPNYQLYLPWQSLSISPELLKDTIYACEMPFDTSLLLKYILYGHIKESFPGIKTLLLGQGSDEFNGGYCHNVIEKYFSFLSKDKHSWTLFWQALQQQKKLGQTFRSKAWHTEYLNFIDENYLDNFKDDPWECYLKYSSRSLDGYNLWHEDRNTAAHQLENRVPFLDHRLVEYTARVPKHLRSKLFWEKNILRKALKPFLPEEVTQRPKVPFIYGAWQRYSYRTLYETMKANHDAFINEAIFDNPYIQEIFDMPYLRNYYKKTIPECPTHDAVEALGSLASLGLLCKWAQENQEIKKEGVLDLKWMHLNEDNKEAIATTLSSKGNIAASSVLNLAPGIELLCNSSKTSFYISKNQEIQLTLDKKSIIEFLQLIDGEKTVGEILSEIHYKMEDVLVDLEESLEYGVVSIENTTPG